MGDRISIFDVFGTWLGDFLPAGAGCGCGPMAAAIFVLFMCGIPVINLVVPPVLLFVSMALFLYSKYRYRKLLLVFSGFLFILWMIGIVALASGQ